MQLLLMQICEEYALLIVLWIYVKEILLLYGLLKGESLKEMLFMNLKVRNLLQIS